MKQLTKKLSLWQRQPFIRQLYRQFPDAEIFLVGGAVRDLLLDRPTKDFDFVVRNVSKDKLEALLSRHGRVNLVGKRFGVFKFKPKGWAAEEIDIALPRTEHTIRQTGAYKDFVVHSNAKLDIVDDLSRRDFTINAMAVRLPRPGAQLELIDPFGGQADLQRKKIRTVGQPAKRFAEDYSRMLRAIRFACQLGFSIEPTTLREIKRLIKNLNKTVSGERVIPFEVISAELHKALIARPTSAIELFDQTGVVKMLFPELLKMKRCPQPTQFHAEGDVWRHTVLALDAARSKKFIQEFKQPAPPEVIWGLLFHDLGKPFTLTKTDRIRFNNHDNVSAEKFRLTANRLKLASPGLDIDLTEQIIRKHMLPAHADISQLKQTTLEKYFFNPNFPGQQLLMLIFADISATIPKSGKPDFTDYRALRRRIASLGGRQKNQKTLPKPLVSGHDLIKTLKLKPGPQFGRLLERLREAQLRGTIKTKQQALVYLKKSLVSSTKK